MPDLRIARRDVSSPELLDRARELLAKAETLPQILKVRSAAKAAEQYFRAAEHSRELAKEAAELRLRADKKAGLILIEMAEQGERARSGKELQRATLSDLGIEKTQSHRWQAMAEIPEAVFEAYIEQAKSREFDELTTAGLMRAVKEEIREGRRATNRRIVEGSESADTLIGESYPTIVIDPPWDWGDEGDVDHFGRGRPVYATMPIHEITALPVSDLAAENAHLYLWITNRSLPKGFGLLEAWGFRYVTVLTWVKPSIGMGNYFRGSTEHVLFGVRGSLEILARDQGTWFAAQRPPQHSAKPPEFYQLIERCSPAPWLEMFGRGPRKGWSVWGAESGGGEA